MKCEIKTEWKPVKDFEDRYEISNKGLLHCLKTRYTKEHYTYGNNGGKYFTIGIRKGKKRNLKGIHVLVWETFVGPIPEGYEIHHKNHNPKDNRLDNLELLSNEEHYKIHIEDRRCSVIKNCSKPVLQYTKDGQFVAEYPSIIEAERNTGINNAHITECCRGIRKTTGGYVWKYKEVA